MLQSTSEKNCQDFWSKIRKTKIQGASEKQRNYDIVNAKKKQRKIKLLATAFSKTLNLCAIILAKKYRGNY